MARNCRIPHLLRALQAMLPGARIELLWQRPWHSMTFAGEQLGIRIHMTGSDVAGTEQLRTDLPEMVFTLPGCFVAELTVSPAETGEDLAPLEVEALVVAD